MSPAGWARSRALPGAILGLALALPHLFRKPFEQHVLIMILLFMFLGQAWNLIGGYAGQWSLSQAAFFGIGAYVSTLLLLRADLSPWIGMVAGAVLTTAVALLIGYPCFRLRGHFFAMATVTFGEIVRLVTLHVRLSGGSQGLVIPIDRIPSVLFFMWHEKLPYYYIILGFAVGAHLLVRQVERSRIGLYLRAIKQDEEGAQSRGIRTTRYKMFVMGVSAFLTAMAGTFYAQYNLYIDPHFVMPTLLSVKIMLIPILGGVATVWGPAIGAAILIPLSEYTRVLFAGGGRGLDLVVYGLLILILSVYRPGGILSLIRRA
jgi:branched-chain amino acid transport system permease protein